MRFKEGQIWKERNLFFGRMLKKISLVMMMMMILL